MITLLTWISIFVVLVTFNNGFYFLEFHKLVYCFVSNFGVLLDSFKVHHFIHVVGRNRTSDFLIFFVVPDRLVFLELALVHFKEKGKWSRFVHFLSLLVLFVMLVVMMMIVLSYLDVGVCITALFLLHVVGVSDVETVGVVFSGLVILWLQTRLTE